MVHYYSLTEMTNLIISTGTRSGSRCCLLENVIRTKWFTGELIVVCPQIGAFIFST